MVAADNWKGITLLEMLVSVVLISIAPVVMLASQSAATGQVRSKVYGDAATATREAEEVVSLMPLPPAPASTLPPSTRTPRKTPIPCPDPVCWNFPDHR